MFKLLQPVSPQLRTPKVCQFLNARFSGHIFLHPEDTFGSVVRLGLVEQVEPLQQPLVLLVVQLPQITDVPPSAGYPDKTRLHIGNSLTGGSALTGESECASLAGFYTGRDRRGAAAGF